MAKEMKAAVTHEGNITRVVLDPGDMVICDICGVDWTDSTKSGGFLRGSYAVCPDCEDGERKKLKFYGELHHIRATCPPKKSFADWVRQDLR